MSNPYIGEIRMFGGNFPPNGWAICAGQSIPISENDALFVLIGTTYGGDGQETFNLPDLQGRVPIHMGQSPTGTTFTIGEKGGVESVTLTLQQLPNHTHPLQGTAVLANLPDPANNLFAQTRSGNQFLEDNPANPMANAISPVGGTQPHDNMQPYLCINFIISLFGIFPTQT